VVVVVIECEVVVVVGVDDITTPGLVVDKLVASGFDVVIIVVDFGAVSFAEVVFIVVPTAVCGTEK